jgi:hypothetical protein
MLLECGTRWPSVSVPSAPNAMPSVIDTAAPDDEPPGIRPAPRS